MSAEEPPRYTASASVPPRLRPQLSAASCGVGVLVTGVVYWVAASHANVLARHAVRQMPLDWSEIRAILSQGWPMVSASFIPLGVLLLMGALVPQSLPQSMSPWPLPP